MGGNCLKNVVTRRYSSEEYWKVVAYVLEFLRKDFPNRKINNVPTYSQKDSWGDLDVLMESDNLTIDMVEYIQKAFQPIQIVKNGSVISFNVNDFQVDLILFSSLNYDTALSYYSWSILGNLRGKIYHKARFSLTAEGLKYHFRDNNYEFSTIVVSRDIPTIFAFMDYNYERFSKGFITLEEIFVYAVSTSFFNKEMYALDKLSSNDRIRDAKNRAFNSFLTWLETAENLPEYPWNFDKEIIDEVSNQKFLDRSFEFFPEFKKVYDETMVNFDLWKKAKELFNGKLVQELTNLSGIELGSFMKFLRDQFPENKNKFLVEMGKEKVINWILNNFKNYKEL